MHRNVLQKVKILWREAVSQGQRSIRSEKGFRVVLDLRTSSLVSVNPLQLLK